MLIYIIGVLSGIGLPVQTSINSKLEKRLGSPFYASFFSFSGAVLFLIIALLCAGGNPFFDTSKLSGEPLWIFAGGILGLILVSINILSAPRIGSAETVIFCVLGQIIMGLLIDEFGLFGSREISLSIWRIIGAAFVITGVFIVVCDNKKVIFEEENLKRKMSFSFKCLLRTLGILAGVAAACQVAVNGELARVMASRSIAAFISFLTGLLSCSIVVVFNLLFKGIHINKNEDNQWYLYTGGIFGVLCVFVNIYLVHNLGTGMAVVIALIGQIFGGVAVDRIGFLRPDKRPVTLRKILGALVMILGTGIIQFL